VHVPGCYFGHYACRKRYGNEYKTSKRIKNQICVINDTIPMLWLYFDILPQGTFLNKQGLYMSEQPF